MKKYYSVIDPGSSRNTKIKYSKIEESNLIKLIKEKVLHGWYFIIDLETGEGIHIEDFILTLI